MKNGVAIALIVVGGCLLLGPLLANVYTSNRDKERVAEFYSRNTNAATLPNALYPSGYNPYDWGCFVAGAIFAGIGVVRSRSVAPSHPA